MSHGAARWTSGYTSDELDVAQEKYNLCFPPDLVALLLDRRLVQSFDWRTDDEQIRKKLAWPLEGMLFDIENHAFWLGDWGERPDDEGARREVATAALAAAPPLIPIYSHRYLPAEPNEAGNPVFSVYQTDIIYYGMNLDHYLTNEFEPKSGMAGSQAEVPAPRHIRFWSDMAARTLGLLRDGGAEC